MQIRLPPAADVAQAVEIWRKNDPRLEVLMTRYGDAAPALRHYGLVLWDSGQLPAASQALTGAAALEPGNARTWGDLAGVFNAQGHRAEAAACTEASLMRDATRPQMWMQLGSLRSALGELAASGEAFQKALVLDETLVDAWVGLGLALLSAKRFRDAIQPFQQAVARGKGDDPSVQNCLGQALFSVGDFAGATYSFAVASLQQPDNHALLLKRARAQFAVDAIVGPPEDAVAALRQLPLSAKEVEQTVHDGFHLLSTYDYRAAAIRLGTYRLARAPDDTVQAYLLATLKGEPMERAPNRYIISFFDKFAEEFDQKLVDVLGYKVPGEIAQLVQRTGRPVSRVLDLGCGTGLLGPLLAAPGRSLTGVDLSPRMLDKARRLGCYDLLIEGEALAFLDTCATSYDLVATADVLIYFGDLSPVFARIARALPPGGLWALSIETVDDQDVIHLPSGRFAHSLAYIAREATAAAFEVLVTERTTIRLDANRPAVGAVLLLSKV